MKTLAKQLLLQVWEVHLKQCQRLQMLMFLMFVLTNFFWCVKFSLLKKLYRQKKQNYYKIISINKDRSATSFKLFCIKCSKSIYFSEENVQ